MMSAKIPSFLASVMTHILQSHNISHQPRLKPFGSFRREKNKTWRKHGFQKKCHIGSWSWWWRWWWQWSWSWSSLQQFQSKSTENVVSTVPQRKQPYVLHLSPRSWETSQLSNVPPVSYGTRRTCRGQLRTQRAETRQKRHLNNTAASEVYYQWTILVLTNKPPSIFLKNQLILCKDSVMIHGKSKIFFKLLNQLKLWKKSIGFHHPGQGSTEVKRSKPMLWKWWKHAHVLHPKTQWLCIIFQSPDRPKPFPAHPWPSRNLEGATICMVAQKGPHKYTRFTTVAWNGIFQTVPHGFAFRSSKEEHCHFWLMMKAVQLDSHMMIESLKDLADHRLPRFPLLTNPTHKTLSQIQQGRQSNMFAQSVCLCVRRNKPRQNVDAEMDVKRHGFLKIFMHFCK